MYVRAIVYPSDRSLVGTVCIPPLTKQFEIQISYRPGHYFSRVLLHSQQDLLLEQRFFDLTVMTQFSLIYLTDLRLTRSVGSLTR